MAGGLFIRVTQWAPGGSVDASFSQVFRCEELIMQKGPNENVHFRDAIIVPYLFPYLLCSDWFLGYFLVSFFDIVLPSFSPADTVLRCDTRWGQAMKGGEERVCYISQRGWWR